MNRYFLEVCYKGTNYAGFQVQQNAPTIQSEVEKAMEVFFRRKIQLTGSSRTDSGVHALQNYFHFDFPLSINKDSLYNLNAILPSDIAVLGLHLVNQDAHCRFDALSREYKYVVYRDKNPFLEDGAYYYPYTLDMDMLKQAAEMIKGKHDFKTFSKRNTQVKTFVCEISDSRWMEDEKIIVFYIKGNRFLRGMVRGLVGTMLQVGRKKIDLDDWSSIISSGDCSLADFSVPGKGLWLMHIDYSETCFLQT